MQEERERRCTVRLWWQRVAFTAVEPQRVHARGLLSERFPRRSWSCDALYTMLIPTTLVGRKITYFHDSEDQEISSRSRWASLGFRVLGLTEAEGVVRDACHSSSVGEGFCRVYSTVFGFRAPCVNVTKPEVRP